MVRRGSDRSSGIVLVTFALVALFVAVLAGASPIGAPPAAAADVSYAGEWHATGTRTTCLGENQCSTSPAPAQTFRLRGPCDGVGACVVELVTDFGWEPLANPSCAGRADGDGQPGFQVEGDDFPRLSGRFTTADGDPTGLRVELRNVVLLRSPAEGVSDLLVATRTSIPPGSDVADCRPPEPPTKVTAVAYGRDRVRLDWTAAPQLGTGPDPWYSASTSSPAPVGCERTGTGATSCTITGLDAGGTYTFTVTAHNVTGEAPSAPSNAVHLVDCVPDGIQRFVDVGPTHPFCADIAWLAEGMATGYPDGTFRSTTITTRQALAAFLFRADFRPTDTSLADHFLDVGVAHPFRVEIEWYAARGWEPLPADGLFHSTVPVTRAALAHVLHARAGSPAFTPPATPTFVDVPAGSPDFLAIEWLADAGIAHGYADGGFHPDAPVTRQSLAAFLHRAGPRPAP